MSKAKIFLIEEDDKNVREMLEAPYEAEEVLQQLLILKPDLLPGDQIDPENPREWLLIKDEMGVPDEMSASDRWSLDHLFLDQDGIPTFVECKRASDTRNRREVVAQMLDYAANGLMYWSVDRLRQTAAETWRDAGLDDKIRQLLKADSDIDIEDYWKKVEGNLGKGKVRLIFVADEIPKELRRLVEFLNEKMSDVEVLAVEVKQFVDKDRKEKGKAIVPRVIGFTEKSRPPTPPTKAPLTQEEFLAKCTPEAAHFFREVLTSAQEKGHFISWGSKSFSVRTRLGNESRVASFIYGWFPSTFQVYLGYLQLSEQEALNLRQELKAFGIFQETGKWTFQAVLQGEVLNQASTVLKFIFNKIDEIAKRAAALS